MGEELQPNMVRPQLYLASVRTEVYKDILDQNGITHILQVCPWPGGSTWQPVLIAASTVPQTLMQQEVDVGAVFHLVPCRREWNWDQPTPSTTHTCSCHFMTCPSRTSLLPSLQPSDSSSRPWMEVGAYIAPSTADVISMSPWCSTASPGCSNTISTVSAP